MRSLSLLALTVACAAALPGTLLSRASELLPSYDYVVIGGGTAGLVVANRLSENPAKTVLVIEAGPILYGEEEFNDIMIPGTNSFLSTRYTWNITSLPNSELNNRSRTVVTPRIVGGGTALNGMVFDRGSKRDYDEWAEYVGDPGWGWDSLLPYFMKAETFTPPDEEIRAEYGIEWEEDVHGTDGPINASYPTFVYPHNKVFMEAEKALGIPIARDQANGNPIGSYWTPNSINPDGEVRSYAKNYNELAKTRPNYHLLTGQTVTKINIVGGKATGVTFSTGRNATTTTITAKKEVILSAGGIHSPRLLQLSGIGDARLLQKFSIPVQVDLPGVGNNYQDHSGVTISYNLTLNPDPAWMTTNLTYRQEMLELYLHNRTGPFTIAFGGRLSFYPLPMISENYTAIIAAGEADTAQYLRADIHPTVLAGWEQQKKLLLASFATNESAVHENVISLASIQKPLSRGFVEIVSSDPFDLPNVDWRTLSNPFDRDILLAGIRFVRRLLARPELAAWNAAETAPGTQVQADDELVSWIRQNMTPTFFHSSCSCAMGRRVWGGVVDSRLSVYGVQGLRVVDASVFPLIPAAHLSASVYAVAERAADLIKEEW